MFFTRYGIYSASYSVPYSLIRRILHHHLAPKFTQQHGPCCISVSPKRRGRGKEDPFVHNQLIPSLHQCTLQNFSTADLSLFPSVCTVPSFAHFFANLRHRRTFRSRNFSLRALFFLGGGGGVPIHSHLYSPRKRRPSHPSQASRRSTPLPPQSLRSPPGMEFGNMAFVK